MKKPIIKMMKISPNAKLFSKAHESDACYDIYALEEYIIEPGQIKFIKTGIKLEIPIGYEGVIRPRSGLSSRTKNRIANSPGTIDAGYRGEIMILMENIDDIESFPIYAGDRIAQIAFREVPDVEMLEVDSLENSDRGEGGFGSTGT